MEAESLSFCCENIDLSATHRDKLPCNGYLSPSLFVRYKHVKDDRMPREYRHLHRP